MNWTIEEVRHAFNGRLIGNLKMRKVVCETLLYLPADIIKRITATVWFISSPEDAWAFTFRGEEIKDRHLIILSDELLKEDELQIKFTIMHEIGHVILEHKNSIGIQQTESEIKQQELAADQFANKYLNY